MMNISRLTSHVSRFTSRALRLLLLITLLSLPIDLAKQLGIAHAQTGGGYNLEWNTVDNGGATFATGGGYELGGTIGQPDAGALSGGGYTLQGGFWVGSAIPTPPEYHIYLPLVLRNS